MLLIFYVSLACDIGESLTKLIFVYIDMNTKQAFT